MALRTRLLTAAAVALAFATLIGAVLLLTPGKSSFAKAAERVGGQAVRTQMQIGYVEDGEAVSMSGTGVQSADGTRVRMDMKMSMEGEEEPVDQKIVVIGDNVWVGGPQMEEVLPEGKRWMHAVDKAGTVNTMSMSEFADFLKEADEVSDKGETVIRGERVTHYQGHVNVRELAKKTGGEAAQRYAEFLDGRDLFLPLEAWLAEDGRVLRLALTCEVGDDSMSMTIDVLEYGVPADITAPPESESISEAEFDRLTSG